MSSTKKSQNRSRSSSRSKSSRKNSFSKSNYNQNDESSQLNLIRVKNIENNPSPIGSISTESNIHLLALARNDNSIEVWTTNSWVQLIKIPGKKGLEIRKIFIYYPNNDTDDSSSVDFDKLRLFTCGLNGYLVEWDLFTSLPKFSYKNAAGIWDFAFKEKIFLLASNDGVPRAVKVKKHSEAYIIKQFAKTESKVLSVVWENFSKSSKTRIFYTGHSNGKIRKWNFETGQVLLTLSNPTSSADNPLIWSLCSINSKFLLVGDSNGKLTIYDINFGVLVKEINEHVGDILSIISNNSNTSPTAYFTGADSLVGNIKLNMKTNEWILTSTFRGQSHDINSLALLNDNYLVSGGVTTDICIYRLFDGMLPQKYEKKASTNIKRHISPFEHRNNYFVSAIHNGNFIVMHKKNESCDLYNINAEHNSSVFLARVFKSKNSIGAIIGANISQDGKMLAMSYDKLVILYSFDIKGNEIKKLGKANYQANFIFFSNNNKILLVSQKDSKIYILKTNLELESSIALNSNRDIILNCVYDSGSNCLSLSTLTNRLYFVDINKGEVNVLPHPDCYITRISFNEESLITIDENNLIYIIDLKTKKFSRWTTDRINKKDYPENYLKWYNKIFGCVPLSKTVMILYTDYNYIKVDLTKQIPSESIIEKNKMDKYLNSDWDKIVKEYHKKLFDDEYKGKGRNIQKYKEELSKNNTSFNKVEAIKKEFNLQNDNFKIVSRFNSIMSMELLNKNKLLVIENNWDRIVKTFPGAVVKPSYGH